MSTCSGSSSRMAILTSLISDREGEEVVGIFSARHEHENKPPRCLAVDEDGWMPIVQRSNKEPRQLYLTITRRCHRLIGT